jgi:hypothetical protein
MELTPRQMNDTVLALVEGGAKLQARAEMLECIVLALIQETPPAHPLWQKALRTAREDWDRRSKLPGREPAPATDGAALALWNELMNACARPGPSGT